MSTCTCRKKDAGAGQLLAENLCAFCVFILVFVTYFPIDAYLFTTAGLSLCEWCDMQTARIAWAAVVALLSVIGTLCIGGIAPRRLWGWRKRWEQMVPIWKQNAIKPFMLIGDVPLKRKMTICLCWLYIILRILCIVVYFMPSSGMIASEVYKKFSDIKYCTVLYLPSTCVITLFGIGTILFYFAVQVPPCLANNQKNP